MAGRNFLFVPGPTNVPERVQRAMNVSMEDHRSPVFPELTRACLNGLKPVFKTTTGTPLFFPSSGTGCWEAALTNCLNSGDRILTSRFGQFSHLWADMCTRLGFDVEVLDTPWGEGAPIERYLAKLTADTTHKIKAVLVCQNETATSQKALDASKTATARRCYFDYADMVQANASGYFPYTPSLPMMYGLRESLAMIEEEGLENIFHRHAYLAGGVRAAVLDGWKLRLCAVEPRWHSDTVSAIMVPDGINGADVIARAFRRYNLSLGAGLSKVAGKLFRIGHLGDLNELMVLGALAGSELAMIDVGIKIEPGSGVAAAQTYWRSHSPVRAEQSATAARSGLAA